MCPEWTGQVADLTSTFPDAGLISSIPSASLDSHFKDIADFASFIPEGD